MDPKQADVYQLLQHDVTHGDNTKTPHHEHYKACTAVYRDAWFVVPQPTTFVIWMWTWTSSILPQLQHCPLPPTTISCTLPLCANTPFKVTSFTNWQAMPNCTIYHEHLEEIKNQKIFLSNNHRSNLSTDQPTNLTSYWLHLPMFQPKRGRYNWICFTIHY